MLHKGVVTSVKGKSCFISDSEKLRWIFQTELLLFMFTFYYSLFLAFSFYKPGLQRCHLIKLTRIQITELIPLSALYILTGISFSRILCWSITLFRCCRLCRLQCRRTCLSVGVWGRRGLLSRHWAGVLVFSGSGVGVLCLFSLRAGVLFSGSGVGLQLLS